jgi:HAD superfamily hydrolase (TIGR01490 family)
MSEIAAFFDLDGTLYEGYLGEALTRYHVENRVNRRQVLRYALASYPLYFLHKAGLYDYEKAYYAWGANLAWLVRGMTRPEADALWHWILHKKHLPHLRPEMKEALTYHQQNRHLVVLVSGSFVPYVEMFAAEMGATDYIATPLEFVEGRYTGEIIPPLNVGDGKLQRIHAFLDAHHGEIDLAQSYFYTDSVVDAPVMELVGKPVAVYPDDGLRTLATERAWEIIG